MTDAESVVHRTAVVVNQRGLHARAAALVARVAGRFEAEVMVANKEEEVSALSIMGMLMLAATTGTTLRITAAGADAADAADTLARLVENGFEEEDFPGY
jgi:phosphocarrier protein